jgi:hypothetical protein
MTQTRSHGALGAHSCFKCGQAISQTNGVRYLNHDWCVSCAKTEAEVRIRRPAARELTGTAATNGGTPADTTAKTDLPPAIQTLLATMGGTARSWHWRVALTGATAGVLLLLVGLLLILGAPITASTGPMLALAGSILPAAVIHRR